MFVKAERMSKLSRCFSAWACIAILAAFAQTTRAQQANILLIIADDYGVDASPLYTLGGDEIQATPTLAGLAAAGVVFDNAWSNASCSVTRGTILAGQHGFRTGLTVATVAPGSPDLLIQRTSGYGLDPEQIVALPSLIDTAGYSTALIGKSHVTAASDANEAAHDPGRFGFNYHAGFLGAAPQNTLTRPVTFSYFDDWYKVVDTDDNDPSTLVISTSDTYVTSDQINEASTWIAQQESEGNPWFLQLALAAPHFPWELPPAQLVPQALKDSLETAIRLTPGNSTWNYTEGQSINLGQWGLPITRLAYNSLVAAMDTELNRLHSGMDAQTLANTYIIFIGDNGTPVAVTSSPFDEQHAKNTLFQGGVHVPLVISGPGINGPQRSAALAHSVDLYPTILEMAGIDAATAIPAGYPIDGFSLKGEAETPSGASYAVRSWNYSEQNITGAFYVANACNLSEEDTLWSRGEAIRDERYKIKRNDDPVCYESLEADPNPDTEYPRGPWELYDLLADPLETTNMLDDADAPGTMDIFENLCEELRTFRSDDPAIAVIDCSQPQLPLPPPIGC